jgi:hypothetical protein
VIRKGLETAKPWQDYNQIALEGAVRQQADWLIGINLTRYMICGNNTLIILNISMPLRPLAGKGGKPCPGSKYSGR